MLFILALCQCPPVCCRTPEPRRWLSSSLISNFPSSTGSQCHRSFKPGFWFLHHWGSSGLVLTAVTSFWSPPALIILGCFASRAANLMSVGSRSLRKRWTPAVTERPAQQKPSRLPPFLVLSIVILFSLRRAFLWFIILIVMFPSYSLTNHSPMWRGIKCFSEVQMVKLSHKRQRLAFV